MTTSSTFPPDIATGKIAKSCASCPSLLTQQESVEFFGKTIGSPMCAQFGTVL